MASAFGRYRLLRQLGRGGMAEVFLARMGEGPLAKLLAIKRLLPAYSQNRRLVKRLAAEARLTVWLTHPNIVQVFDFGRIGDSYFIAMEYVDGCDLRSLILPPDNSPLQLPLEVALEIAYRVTDALRYAHNCTDASGTPLGIIHRDVSPHNVLISRDGHPKLADFGVARAVSSDRETQPGAVLGKFSYMAPEQARGEAYDARVDLYAAGATLYQMLTGSKPFPDRTLTDAIVSPLPAPPSSLRPSIPPALDQLVLRALEPRPDRRFPSAADMGDALLEQLQALGGPPKPHQICRLVEESLRLRDAARRRADETGNQGRQRATLNDIDPGEDSLIGAEVTRVQRHFFPPGLQPRPSVEDSLPSTDLMNAPTLVPPPAGEDPDTVEPAPPPAPRAPSLPPTAPWPQDTPAPGPPRARLDLAAWWGGLAPGMRLWVLGGLGLSAALVIFGLGLLVGRATVSTPAPGRCPPRTPAATAPAPVATVVAAAPQPPDAPDEPAPRDKTTAVASPAPETPEPNDHRPSRPRRRPSRAKPSADQLLAVATRHEAKPASRPPAASPARAVSETQWSQAVQLLKRSQQAYVDGNHPLAIQLARKVLGIIPDSMGAWQVIGASSCYLGRAADARRALYRVDVKRRQLIRTICGRNNIPL